MTQDQGAAEQFGLHRVTLIHQDRLQLRRGHVGGGGNGAFQALDMVMSWGVRDVLLVGVDARDNDGLNHWHGAHGKGLHNPTETAYARWVKAFSVASTQLGEIGATVRNASPISAVTCFAQMDIETWISSAKTSA